MAALDGSNTDIVISVQGKEKEIDDIVRLVRFPGWQQTSAGEREVKKALRGALSRYKLHSDKDLFEKAYGYIRHYH